MRPEPKFEIGQIVLMRSLKRPLPFQILDRRWFDDSAEWGYQWNRNNWAAEHMLRAQTEKEIGPRNPRGDATVAKEGQ